MSDEEIERIKEIAKPKVGVTSGPSGGTEGGGSFLSSLALWVVGLLI